MASPLSFKKSIEELERLRGEFGEPARSRKLELLTVLASWKIRSPHLLSRLHSVACFLRAFPEDVVLREAAIALLDSFPSRIAAIGIRRRRQLDDSGIVGTAVVHEFSYDMAVWLVKRFPKDVEIAWDLYESTELLDALLLHFVEYAEQQAWEDGDISTRDWIKYSKGNVATSDLQWLLRQVRRSAARERVLATLYDDATVPLQWRLTSLRTSHAGNSVESRVSSTPRSEWRRTPRKVRSELVKPISKIKLLPPQDANEVIDVARTALALRQREVYAMTYANAEEVYSASIGCDMDVAVIGVLPQWRLSIEGNYGYVVLSNGMPIGYGGASPLFRQVNTGVSILDDYRRGESRFLFLQVLRVLRTLFECDRFIANPYQFGADNDDAVATGAFWFYYKLGFRPVEATVRRLARAEAIKRQNRPGSRVERKTMKRLVSGDLELVVRNAKSTNLFEERWLGVLARLALRRLGAYGQPDHRHAVLASVSTVASILAIQGRRRWPVDQRRALERLAPLFDLIPDLADWPSKAKKACVELIRAKGATQERDFVRRLAGNGRLLHAWAKACRDDAR